MTAPHASPERIERNWRAITAQLDAPTPARAERFVRRLGVPAHVARVAMATPSLRRAWFVAVGVVVFVGLAATDPAQPRDDLFLLLVLAPLVPVLGVAMSFGPDADPAYEISLSTPMRGLHLVLLRATTVLSTSLVVLAGAAILAPGRSWMAFAWVVPSLALSAASLALMTYTSPRRAASIVSAVWLVGVTVARSNAADPLAAFAPLGQAAMVALTAGALIVTFRRRDRFDLLRVQW